MATFHRAGIESDVEVLQEHEQNGSQNRLRLMFKAAFMGGVALGLTAVAAVSLVRSGAGTNKAALGDAVALQLNNCRDTPGWANGWTGCKENNYQGAGCEDGGLNCAAYLANGWCANGAVLKAWAVGPKLNNPQVNCCACGGGIKAQPLEVEPEAQPAQPQKESSSCSAHAACADAGLTGECCPNADGVLLDCCNSAPTCKDTPSWTNGYTGCSKHGLTKEQGCVEGGVTCLGYVNQSFCAAGAAMPGKEWTLGAKYNNPEQNCCACGKGVQTQTN